MKIRSSEQWHRIDSVFGEAQPLAKRERAAYLDESCGADRDLRAEVERLLTASDEAGDFLESFDDVQAARLLEPFAETAGAIGRYKVVRTIGSGGMGVVYLAEDAALKRQVAVKLLPPWLNASLAAKRKLVEEARAASAIDHPNIATVHEIGETEDGRIFITMSYYEGDTLRGRLERGHLSVAEAADIALQTARGLVAAHRKAIVHRDIKPENILLKSDGIVKILDFGIAQVEAQVLSQGAAATGTTAYMSPEQTLASSVDSRTDVWSLGVMLYEMLANERPFRGATREDVVLSIRNDPLQLHRHVAHVPGSLRVIVERCLQKDPAARYQSAEELARDLESVVGEFSPNAGARSHQPGGFVRRHVPGVVAILAGASVIALVMAVIARPRVKPVSHSRASVAVFPFTPGVPDTLLQRLGRDLVSTLSASLHGMGDLRTIDAHTVLGKTGSARKVPSPAEVSALAHGMGAGIVIRGSLARVGTRVRADGVLLSADSAAPLAHVSATAAGDDLAMLTDSLTWGLLHQLSRIRGEPALAGGVTTRSLPALRAYLEGERLVDEYRMRAAATAFARAIAADSTFWFAYWRHAWAREFHALPVDAAITAAYLAHLADFPIRDRLLIEARTTKGLSDRLARLQSLVMQFPDYWPGWFELGELHVREAPFAGATLAEAEAPLRRAVRINADFVPGWDRLLWVAIAARDTVNSARVLGELKRLRFDSTSTLDDEFDMLLLYRHLHHLARTSGVPDAVLADSLARALGSGGSASANGMPDRMQGGMARYEFHGARIDLAARQLKGALVRRAFQWHVIANSWAARGSWDSALVAEERSIGQNSLPMAGLRGYRLAVVGAWLGAVEPSTAARWRNRAVSTFDRMSRSERAELAWVDGLVAAARRDIEALASARKALRRTGAAEAALMDSSLSAFASELAGNRPRALEVLLALEHNRRNVSDTHAFLTGVNRLSAARWLSTAEDTTRAVSLLTWHEAIGDTGPHSLHANALLAPFAYLARARILAAQGQSDAARAHYARFLSNYDAPVQAHRALVEEARAALARTRRQ